MLAPKLLGIYPKNPHLSAKMIDLHLYSRVTLSDILQMQEQLSGIGESLPPWFVDMIERAHDQRLRRDQRSPEGVTLRKSLNIPPKCREQGRPHNNRRKLMCRIHRKPLFKLECGKHICWDCYEAKQ